MRVLRLIESICSICRLPFDTKTPVGFLIAMSMMIIMTSHATLIGACAVSLTCGSSLYVIAASKCVKKSLHSISRNAHSKKKRIHIFDQLTEFVEFHSRIKRLNQLHSLSALASFFALRCIVQASALLKKNLLDNISKF